MGNAIELLPANMLCDTPGCGYVVEVDPRSVRQHIGARCPRCSAVMVTEETAQEAERLLALIDGVNAIAGPVSGDGAKGLAWSTRIDTAGDIAEVSLGKVSK